ncbi:hypothetical protein VP01_1054g4 [Puccinia sorghi]|uniref:Uncharacterized protein n=1 Tax=Puccinia sorghi TaxID=27349 RepID=A0A0L6VU28_9BASI|nr:hypothetical protein VP01_1054g4 [Puccinia sorghi]
MDFSSNLDLHRIVFVQVGLSTLASVAVSPSYNLPIHLYGLFHIDSNQLDHPSSAVLEGLRQFLNHYYFLCMRMKKKKYSILLVLTGLLDVIWMYHWSSTTSGLPFLLIVIGMIMKPISVMTCLKELRRNGEGGLGSFSSQWTGSRGPGWHGQNQTVSGGGGPGEGRVGLHREGPPAAWAPPAHAGALPFRRAEHVAPPEGPSPVSHQASAAALTRHEFALDDDHHPDAKHLSSDEVRRAKQELDLRIAQKKHQIQLQQQQQQQQEQQQHQGLSASLPPSGPSPNAPIDGSGYHTLE